MSTETLQISRQKALDAYSVADATGKQVLEMLLGKESLTLKITEKVRTLEDVCNVLRIQYDSFMRDLRDLPADVQGYMEVKAIAQALNEGWVPDYSDDRQKKYYPWFKYKNGSSGRGLSFSAGYDNTYATVGPRLVFKSAALVNYAVETFPNSFDKYFNQ